MLDDKIRKRVERATVRLPNKGGLGVIVRNNLILTAAHCIDFRTDCSMTITNSFNEKIEYDGRQLLALIYAVEPVKDIAVLGEPDTQDYCEEWENYVNTLDSIEPVEISSEELEPLRDIPAFIYTHKRTWQEVIVRQNGKKVPLLMISGALIEGGTSGGPVVDQKGHLLGVISWTSNTPPYGGRIPRPHLSLPVWAVEKIIMKTSESDDMG